MIRFLINLPELRANSKKSVHLVLHRMCNKLVYRTPFLYKDDKLVLKTKIITDLYLQQIKRKVTEAQLWWLWPDRYELKYQLPSLVVPEETQQSADSSDKQLILKQLNSIARTTNNLAYLDMLSTYTSQVSFV